MLQRSRLFSSFPSSRWSSAKGSRLRIERLAATPLSIPLVEPFVIASGRLETTRSAEIEAEVSWGEARARGIGEAACLPPVTREDQTDVLRAVEGAASALVGTTLETAAEAIESAMKDAFPMSPVTRAGVETALLDAIGRIANQPLRALLGGPRGARTCALETDVTVTIGDPARMAELAAEWCGRGFRRLKVKVGKDVDADARALEAIGRSAPQAKLRVDANGGYRARDAIALARACERAGLDVECWEQPCATDDYEGMAEVARALEPPVIADESAQTVDDVALLARLRAADGVNLKLAKCGGPLHAHRMGLAAQALGLRLMVGGMVETRLGMTAAAHLACALGGVDFVDLDTAWLLRDDPYEGGYQANGPDYFLPDAAGLGITRRLSLCPRQHP